MGRLVFGAAFKLSAPRRPDFFAATVDTAIVDTAIVNTAIVDTAAVDTAAAAVKRKELLSTLSIQEAVFLIAMIKRLLERMKGCFSSFENFTGYH